MGGCVNVLPKSLKKLLKRGKDCLTWDPWSNRSWSQEGEDIVLSRFFGSKRTGFYVDVGAHHPKRFSNTFLLYRRGWHGINIDAMPGSMKLFGKWRPRDVNLELGVPQKEDVIDYYIFNEPALNSFSSELSEKRSRSSNGSHLKEVMQVEVKPLRDILYRYLRGHKIDFLSVDVEGLDLDVLQSNDWCEYRPTLVLAEILQSSLHDLEQDPVVEFMKVQGYGVYAKQVNTVFFKDLTGNSDSRLSKV